MPIETLQIINRTGDDLELAIREKSQCNGCEAKGSCGHHLLEASLGSMAGKKTFTLNGAHLPDMGTGDSVSLAINEAAIVKMSLLLYGVPVLFLLSGAFIGDTIAGNFLMSWLPGEFTTIFFAMAFFMTGLRVVKRYGNQMARETVLLTGNSH